MRKTFLILVYLSILFSLLALSSTKISGFHHARTYLIEDNYYPSNAVLGNDTIFLINMTWSEESGNGIEVFEYDLSKNTTNRLGTISGLMEVFDFLLL